MYSRKKRPASSRRARTALLLFCAGIALALCALGSSLWQKPENKLEANSAGGFFQRGASSHPDASAETGSQAPGFLDSLSLPSVLPNEPGRAGEDLFPLYDQSTGKALEIPGRELLPAALACEMDLFSPEEALKAQAVACYTFFSRKRDNGEQIVCDSENWQVWTSREIMQARWGEDFDNYMGILENVVNQVYGQLLKYEDKPILAAYFAISAGSTEACKNVWGQDLPYLQAMASPGDMLSDGYLSAASFTEEEFREAARAYFTEDPPDFSGPPETWLTGLETTPAGYVSAAVLGGKTVSGTDLRSAFSLRSACFETKFSENRFTFTVRGWGHGVGMSQAGATFLAKRGADYRQILAHYYPGAQLTPSP